MVDNSNALGLCVNDTGLKKPRILRNKIKVFRGFGFFLAFNDCHVNTHKRFSVFLSHVFCCLDRVKKILNIKDENFSFLDLKNKNL